MKEYNRREFLEKGLGGVVASLALTYSCKEKPVEIEKGFAEINGTKLYYEQMGEGHPLVLIHGFTLDTRMWDEQFETFGQHYQVMRYDSRGYGKSAMPTGEKYTHTDDLKALMEYLGIAKAYIVGLSMGGSIAIDFALEYPESIDALITVDSTLGGYKWSPDYGASLLSIFLKAKEAGHQAAMELWLDFEIFEPAMEKPDVAFRLRQIISDYSGWHWLNVDIKNVKPLRGPSIHRLNEISVPTLAIVGGRDSPDFHTIAYTLEQQIPNARKVVIPGVGHMSNMEKPAEFNKIVLDFLSEIGGYKR